MSDWKEIDPREIKENAFKMIGTDWMLVTAGNEEKANTMTASWGGFGDMWMKNCAFVVIRPQRYTKEFVDKEETFSLSFFSDDHRKTLSYLGTVSGRDENKIEKAGLTLEFIDNTPCFKEANTVFICRKMYAEAIREESFLDKSLVEQWFKDKDYHTMYIVEIVKALTK